MVKVMVRNPAIKEWYSEYKYFSDLQNWKSKFDIKARKIEIERMESYQNEIKQQQERERYGKSRTRGKAMRTVIKHVQSG